MFAERILFIFLFCVFAANVLSEASDDFDLDDVNIIFYYGPTYEDYDSYSLEEADLLLQHPKFIHSLTTCFIHGFKNFRHHGAKKMLVDVYAKRNTTNFLFFDWEKLSNSNFTASQENVFKFAPKLADFFIDLFNNGLDEDSFTLFGHSLGASAIEVVAENVIERSQGTMMLSEMIALEPSNEESYDIFILPDIQKSSAKFIQVIHTDAGEKGTKKSVGHVNFWPNNGIPIQPSCTKEEDPQCSHFKSLVYWAESVAKTRESKSFLGYRSGSYKSLLQNGPERYQSGAELMGIDCDSSARGDYYLQYVGTLDNYYELTTPS